MKVKISIIKPQKKYYCQVKVIYLQENSMHTFDGYENKHKYSKTIAEYSSKLLTITIYNLHMQTIGVNLNI